MAAPKRNAMLFGDARKRIQTTQLVNRLQNNALGKLELTREQIKSIEILLKKSIPDLASVAVSGDHEGGPINVIERIIVDKTSDRDG